MKTKRYSENKLIKDMFGFYGEIYKIFYVKNIEDINSFKR